MRKLKRSLPFKRYGTMSLIGNLDHVLAELKEEREQSFDRLMGQLKFGAPLKKTSAKSTA